jgi:hypothetical protein
MGVFEDINRLGTSVLIASHDLALIARMRHRMLTLQRGRLIGDGRPAYECDSQSEGFQNAWRRRPPIRNRPRKKATTMMARTSRRCFAPGSKAIAPACWTVCAGWVNSHRQLFHLHGDGGGPEFAHGPVAFVTLNVWVVPAACVLQISLYLQLEPARLRASATRADQGMPGVADAEYVGRDQALEEFQQQSGLGDALRVAGKPATRRGPGDTEEVDKPTLEALRQKLSDLPKVQQAQLV